MANNDKNFLWSKYLTPFVIPELTVEINTSNYLAQE